MKNEKFALITGASNGIGYELAKLFAKNKFDLILVSRGQDKLDQTKNDLTEFDSEVTTYSADLYKV